MLWGRGVQGLTGPDLSPIYGSMSSQSRYPLDQGRINTTCPNTGLHPLQGDCHEQEESTSFVLAHYCNVPQFLALKALYWGPIDDQLPPGSWFWLIEARRDRATPLRGLLLAASSLGPLTFSREGASGVSNRCFRMGGQLLNPFLAILSFY